VFCFFSLPLSLSLYISLCVCVRREKDRRKAPLFVMSVRLPGLLSISLVYFSFSSLCVTLCSVDNTYKTHTHTLYISPEEPSSYERVTDITDNRAFLSGL
jgi:uncharacterized membrane protein YhaH (DUF805 family)